MSNSVAGAGGVRLAVWEAGDADGPTVLCVHGFPDNASIWDRVVALLAPRHRVITYDVRGAGRSDRPERTADYRLEVLAEDLRAVVEAVSPGRDVHILAHDWGAIQVWHALARGLPAASFTSISGPDLEQARTRMTLRQMLSSAYIPLFWGVPWAATLASKIGLLSRVIMAADSSRRGHPIEHEDVKYGLKLYSANMFRRTQPGSPVGIPIQVLVPTRDPFVGAAIQMVDNAVVNTVRTGHWLPLADPGFVARSVQEFVRDR